MAIENSLNHKRFSLSIISHHQCSVCLLSNNTERDCYFMPSIHSTTKINHRLILIIRRAMKTIRRPLLTIRRTAKTIRTPLLNIRRTAKTIRRPLLNIRRTAKTERMPNYSYSY